MKKVTIEDASKTYTSGLLSCAKNKLNLLGGAFSGRMLRPYCFCLSVTPALVSPFSSVMNG